MKTIEKLRTEKTTRPASKWRNRYLALRDFNERGERWFKGGQEFWGTRYWPDRDTAETYAQWWENRNGHLAKHVGTFPMGAA